MNSFRALLAPAIAASYELDPSTTVWALKVTPESGYALSGRDEFSLVRFACSDESRHLTCLSRESYDSLEAIRALFVVE